MKISFAFQPNVSSCLSLEVQPPVLLWQRSKADVLRLSITAWMFKMVTKEVNLVYTVVIAQLITAKSRSINSTVEHNGLLYSELFRHLLSVSKTVVDALTYVFLNS
jgi:hypothetical protein